MSTPADSLNSNTSASENNSLIGRTGSPMATEFLQEYRGRSTSPSFKHSIVFNTDSDVGLDQLTELRQRINGLEEQRLLLTTTHNEQITNLEGDVALWREQAERGEATRQKLEYELAVIKKALSKEKQSARRNEQEARDILRQHEETNRELSGKSEELSRTLQLREKEMRQMVEAFKKEINDKDSELKRLRDENDKIRKDKEQIENVFSEQENLYSDAQEKLANLRMERDTQTESVRRQLKDLHYAAEREERFKKEMEVALMKIKTLEESTEAERAAHLETKFNSELIQLRVRDLQGALEVEKAAHSELALKAESMSKQISDLETMYNKEKIASNNLKSQLERVEGECSSVRSRLSAEMEGKHSMVTDMSEQLQIHQQSFSELKEELKKAKKRQAYLEETYGGCMKELELLIDNVQHMNQPVAKRGKGKQRDSSPSEVLETLRQLTTDFQKRLTVTSKEVTRLKTECEKMNSECEHYKEIMWKQEKTNKDLQTKLGVSRKELDKVRESLKEHQAQSSSLKVALQRAEEDHYSEKYKGQDLAEEFIRQLKAREEKLENRKLYLHGLYERIRSGPSIPGLPSVEMSDPDWSQLTTIVTDQIAAMMVAFNQANQKVSQLTSSMRGKEELLHQTQESHEDTINKLKEAAKKKEEEWSLERSNMEKHYERHLADLKSKSKKLEETAQQVDHEMQTATSAKSELEETCQRYKRHLDDTQGQLHSALTACSLLIGSFLACRNQITELVSQRDLLTEQMSKFDRHRHQLHEFVLTISNTMGNSGRSDMTKKHSLLTFRKVAILVIAANRIRLLASSRATSQPALPSPQDQSVMLPLIVWPPGLNSERRTAFGSLNVLYHSQVAWIGEEELKSVLHKNMADLKKSLHSEDLNGNFRFCQTAHQCLDQVLLTVDNVVSQQLTSRSVLSEVGPVSPLVRHLANGLSRTLALCAMRGNYDSFSMQETLSSLKKQIVNFTKRLHAAEVERRSLRMEVSRIKDDTKRLVHAENKAEEMERQLLDANAKMKDFVAKGKFDSICEELSRALRREEEAQRVLNQQSEQLEELNLRLNVQTTDDIEKERAIAEAVQGLSDATVDLKRREDAIHQLKKQVIKLEEEKQRLQDRTREAENSLKIKAKDKDSLILYLKTLEAGVEKARRNLMHKPDSQSYQMMFNQLLTSATMTTLDVKEPEASTVQGLLQAFADGQKTAVNKISMLEEEITSHKQHISSLKKEVSAVCRRERDSDGILKSSGDPSIYLSSFPSLNNKVVGQTQTYSYQPERSYGEDFAPLREAMDYSSQATPSSKRQLFDL